MSQSEHTGGQPGEHVQFDPTVNPNLRSWLASANDPATDFPLQNLPFCTFVGEEEQHFIGVRVGDRVADVDMLMHAGALGESELIDRAHGAVHMGELGYLMGDPEAAAHVRERIQAFMLDSAPGGQQGRRLRDKALMAASETVFATPCSIGDYTDFYASIHHAKNVGSMFRPDNPLLPNYKHVPIGYHGRASSIVPSGEAIRRPRGQTNVDNAPSPVFGPSKRLDYELELGCFIGRANELGEPVHIDDAPEHIFGFCIVNDWSARDIQAWEYQPLGPFLAKNFATSVSPYVVPAAALEPFRVAGPARGEDDPQPLEYLRPGAAGKNWGLDVRMEVLLLTEAMAAKGLAPMRVSSGNAKELFWTFPQMIAHHTSNGCNLQPGDLLASGTVSGPTPDSRGCLLEMTWAGNGADGKPLPRKAIELPNGEKRVFLEDGDTVIMRAWCERPGFRRIGFGECVGTVIGAR